ncbi:MAG: NAD(P)-dependent alcohol dehydrogenase [Maritimibacter sp.]
MKIKAAVAREAGSDLSIEELDLEDPRDDEILVKVVATGVCHTDLVVMAGHLPTPMPAVLGHEGAGIVEKVGSAVTKVKPGDHVVMTFNSCGGCPSCHEHEPAYCYEFFPRNFFATRPDGTVAISKEGESIHSNFFGQSSFATYALCHSVNVVKVPETAQLDLLGPLACGIQTGAGAVMNALKVKDGKSFVVFGAGSVGLSAVMAAKASGASTIVAVDLNDSRLEKAKELGATHVVNASSDGVAPRGTCAILGAPMPESEISVDNTDFMSFGKKLIGVVEGASQPDTFIPELIALWQAGKFPFDKLVSFYDFDDINQAVHDSHAGTAIKPIVKMS